LPPSASEGEDAADSDGDRESDVSERSPQPSPRSSLHEDLGEEPERDEYFDAQDYLDDPPP
jgi:hypothetical protein